MSDDDVVLRIAPKEIDRADVLAELEHRFRTVTDDLPVIARVLDELAELDVVRFREPVDDPSKDRLGSLRREVSETDAVVIYMKTTTDANGWWTAVYSTEAGIVGKRFDNAFVSEFSVFDACPGTPAAEAQPGPRPIPEWEMDLLRREDARKREPRVFRSDGPEPPDDVDVLELRCPDECPLVHDWPFLVRGARTGWRWASSPGELTAIPGRWPLGLSLPHDLVEVLS